MDGYKLLKQGHSEFLEEYNDPELTEYREAAAKGQAPRVMVISCCDSRINPAIVTHAGLGDIFSIENVANLVPPLDADDSVSGAVQYAVTVVGVTHIIVIGHSNCGGIRALVTTGGDVEGSPVHRWVKAALPARDKVLADMPDASEDEQCDACERASVVNSIGNLLEFPWVRDAVGKGKLSVHGWHFDIGSGRITEWNRQSDTFEPLV